MPGILRCHGNEDWLLIVYWLNMLHGNISVKVNLYSCVVVVTCSRGGR